MKELKQITVIGLGLLGGSVTLAVLHSFVGVKTIGFTHRASTRRKAKQLAIADEITGDLPSGVEGSDLVILATPVCTFDQIFREIRCALPNGCIVTDVGSTKVLSHCWAAKLLPETVHYIGSHPIAGSQQRGVEFARDDLFDHAVCILTTTKKTNRQALSTLKKFWSNLGCFVKLMTATEHDRILAGVSHLPHIMAASLINANSEDVLKFAGKGFMDASRIASGPTNIWSDILLTNRENCSKKIDNAIAELKKVQKAIKAGDKKAIVNLLEKARNKRAVLIKYKMRKKELSS